jgi:hypothetical protein
MPIDSGEDRLDLVVRAATAGDVEEMIDLYLRVGEGESLWRLSRRSIGMSVGCGCNNHGGVRRVFAY